MAAASTSGRGGLELSFGEKSVTIYFAVFYFLPLIFDFFIDVGVKYSLQGDMPFAGAFLFAFFYLAILLFLRKTINLSIPVKIPFRQWVGHRSLISFVFLTFLTFAWLFSSTFDASFRHSESYSSSGLVPIITFSLKTVAAAYVFVSLSAKKIIELHWYHYVLYIFALYLSFAGSYDVIYASLGIYAWLRSSSVDLIKLMRKRLRVLGFVFIIFVVPTVIFAGMANKIGFEEAQRYFVEAGVVTRAIELYTNRTFYHSYSLGYHINNIGDSFGLAKQAFDIVSYQSIRRVVILLGSEMPNETVQTVNRLNYLLISGGRFYNDTGASPGLLGSMFFLPGSILAFPFHIVLIYNAVGMLDNMMGKARYGPLAYLGGLVVLQALADSMMDKLNPVSAGFIALVIYGTLSSYSRTVPDPACAKQRALLRHR